MISVGIQRIFLTAGHLAFETVTGSRMNTIVILWYVQAFRIHPLQIHDNFRIAGLF